MVEASLRMHDPELVVRIEIVTTTGDKDSKPLSIIGGKGVFTRELEEALIDGRIDLAVHSLKDLPTILPEQLELAAMCEREDPRDALVVHGAEHVSLRELPPGAVVGTSSPRRLAQVKYLRGDLDVKELRGNVDTRLRKLDEGQYDALVLAAAGLNRLGLKNRITNLIDPEDMLPAVGQGALAIETRAEDQQIRKLVELIDHAPTRLACEGERALLRTLGGGCQLPIAAHGVMKGRDLHLQGLVASVDGTQLIRDRISGAADDAESLGKALAERLLHLGADDLLAIK